MDDWRLQLAGSKMNWLWEQIRSKFSSPPQFEKDFEEEIGETNEVGDVSSWAQLSEILDETSPPQGIHLRCDYRGPPVSPTLQGVEPSLTHIRLGREVLIRVETVERELASLKASLWGLNDSEMRCPSVASVDSGVEIAPRAKMPPPPPPPPLPLMPSALRRVQPPQLPPKPQKVATPKQTPTIGDCLAELQSIKLKPIALRPLRVPHNTSPVNFIAAALQKKFAEVHKSVSTDSPNSDDNWNPSDDSDLNSPATATPKKRTSSSSTPYRRSLKLNHN